MQQWRTLTSVSKAYLPVPLREREGRGVADCFGRGLDIGDDVDLIVGSGPGVVDRRGVGRGDGVGAFEGVGDAVGFGDGVTEGFGDGVTEGFGDGVTRTSPLTMDVALVSAGAGAAFGLTTVVVEVEAEFVELVELDEALEVGFAEAR